MQKGYPTMRLQNETPNPNQMYVPYNNNTALTVASKIKKQNTGLMINTGPKFMHFRDSTPEKEPTECSQD